MTPLRFCCVCGCLLAVWAVIVRFAWARCVRSYCVECGSMCADGHRSLCDTCIKIERQKILNKESEV
jgi:hypothetical protein